MQFGTQQQLKSSRAPIVPQRLRRPADVILYAVTALRYGTRSVVIKWHSTPDDLKNRVSELGITKEKEFITIVGRPELVDIEVMLRKLVNVAEANDFCASTI